MGSHKLGLDRKGGVGVLGWDAVGQKVTQQK